MVRTKILRGRNYDRKQFPITVVITDKNRGEEYSFVSDGVQIDFACGNRIMEYIVKISEILK